MALETQERRSKLAELLEACLPRSGDHLHGDVIGALRREM